LSLNRSFYLYTHLIKSKYSVLKYQSEKQIEELKQLSKNEYEDKMYIYYAVIMKNIYIYKKYNIEILITYMNILKMNRCFLLL